MVGAEVYSIGGASTPRALHINQANFTMGIAIKTLSQFFGQDVYFDGS